MSATNPNHGGARPGAGRPKARYEVRRREYLLRIRTARLLSEFVPYGQRSAFVDAVIYSALIGKRDEPR
jgi:hypothetical protein